MKVYHFKNVRTGLEFGVKENQPETVKRLKKDKEEYKLVEEYDHEPKNSVEEQGEEESEENGNGGDPDGEPLMLEGMTVDDVKEAFGLEELKGEAARRGHENYKSKNKGELAEMLLSEETE